MKLRNLFLLSIVLISGLMSACSSNDQVAHNKTTVLGIVTFEPACYEVTKDTSDIIRSDEVYGMELPSGNRTQFLWGAISIEDY